MEYKENNFKDKKNKISISQVNLLHFYIFYVDYMVQRTFIYTLENGESIKLKFEKNNFPHLIGLHKFNSLKNKSANEIIEMIEKNKIDINTLRKSENKILNTELKDRLTFFPCIHFLLNNADYILEYDPFKSIPTRLRADIFINSANIQVILYLAIRKNHIGHISYVPTSIIVDRVNKYKGEKKKITNIKIEEWFFYDK